MFWIKFVMSGFLSPVGCGIVRPKRAIKSLVFFKGPPPLLEVNELLLKGKIIWNPPYHYVFSVMSAWFQFEKFGRNVKNIRRQSWQKLFQHNLQQSFKIAKLFLIFVTKIQYIVLLKRDDCALPKNLIVFISQCQMSNVKSCIFPWV